MGECLPEHKPIGTIALFTKTHLLETLSPAIREELALEISRQGYAACLFEVVLEQEENEALHEELKRARWSGYSTYSQALHDPKAWFSHNTRSRTWEIATAFSPRFPSVLVVDLHNTPHPDANPSVMVARLRAIDEGKARVRWFGFEQSRWLVVKQNPIIFIRPPDSESELYPRNHVIMEIAVPARPIPVAYKTFLYGYGKSFSDTSRLSSKYRTLLVRCLAKGIIAEYRRKFG